MMFFFFQGPIGYSPVCQCGPALHHLERSVHQTREELYEHIDATHQVCTHSLGMLVHLISAAASAFFLPSGMNIKNVNVNSLLDWYSSLI